MWPIDGNSVFHSWHPSAVSGPVAKFNKIFLFEQLSMSYIREIWFPNREHIRSLRKYLVSIFTMCKSIVKHY
jgi:hypothetical protein